MTIVPISYMPTLTKSNDISNVLVATKQERVLQGTTAMLRDAHAEPTRAVGQANFTT